MERSAKLPSAISTKLSENSIHKSRVYGLRPGKYARIALIIDPTTMIFIPVRSGEPPKIKAALVTPTKVTQKKISKNTNIVVPASTLVPVRGRYHAAPSCACLSSAGLMDRHDIGITGFAGSKHPLIHASAHTDGAQTDVGLQLVQLTMHTNGNAAHSRYCR